jgi:excisionase family DNA binding protein
MPGTNETANESTVIPHRLLTLPEAAHYLGCTIWSVRELIWKGQLPYTRFGKRFQVDRHDLDELVDREKRCEGTGPANRRVTQGANGVANTLHTSVAQSLSLNEECKDATNGRKGKKQQHAKVGL